MESVVIKLISSKEALNVPLEFQADLQSQGVASTSQAGPYGLTFAAKANTLARLVAHKWLSRTEDGRVALGHKSFVELATLRIFTYLVVTYASSLLSGHNFARINIAKCKCIPIVWLKGSGVTRLPSPVHACEQPAKMKVIFQYRVKRSAHHQWAKELEEQ